MHLTWWNFVKDHVNSIYTFVGEIKGSCKGHHNFIGVIEQILLPLKEIFHFQK